jgi:hypothetical protein
VFEWVRPHTLRKTVATFLDGSGATARLIADQLGHARISTYPNDGGGQVGEHRRIRRCVRGHGLARSHQPGSDGTCPLHRSVDRKDIPTPDDSRTAETSSPAAPETTSTTTPPCPSGHPPADWNPASERDECDTPPVKRSQASLELRRTTTARKPAGLPQAPSAAVRADPRMLREPGSTRCGNGHGSTVTRAQTP